MTYSVELLSVVPGLDQSIAHGVCSGLISTLVVEIEPGSRQSILDVVDDRSLNRTLVTTDVRAHELPHFLLTIDWLAELRSVERG